VVVVVVVSNIWFLAFSLVRTILNTAIQMYSIL